MPVLPGGKIISGVGGRIWIIPIPVRGAAPRRGNLLVPNTQDPKLVAHPADSVDRVPFLDIAQWSIIRTTILAEIPHSGCTGGLTRRVIGWTWRFSASLPLDQMVFPESLLINDRFAIAFYLGDTQMNPEAVYMGMTQAYYFSPRACISHVTTVLNASGDVIRVNIAGEESCRLFLLPLEAELCDQYSEYLSRHKGWL